MPNSVLGTVDFTTNAIKYQPSNSLQPLLFGWSNPLLSFRFLHLKQKKLFLWTLILYQSIKGLEERKTDNRDYNSYYIKMLYNKDKHRGASGTIRRDN